METWRVQRARERMKIFRIIISRSVGRWCDVCEILKKGVSKTDVLLCEAQWLICHIFECIYIKMDKKETLKWTAKANVWCVYLSDEHACCQRWSKHSLSLEADSLCLQLSAQPGDQELSENKQDVWTGCSWSALFVEIQCRKSKKWFQI